jgi:hypothetical protein
LVCRGVAVLQDRREQEVNAAFMFELHRGQRATLVLQDGGVHYGPVVLQVKFASHLELVSLYLPDQLAEVHTRKGLRFLDGYEQSLVLQ